MKITQKRGKRPKNCIWVIRPAPRRKLVGRGKKMNLNRGGGDGRNAQYISLLIFLGYVWQPRKEI